MRRLKTSILAAALAGAAVAAHAQAVSDDPYIWLEDVAGPRAMGWVEAHNAESQAVLEADPRYARYYAEALAIAQAKDRIPYGRFLGGQIYNFWQDADHVRGIYRRTTLAGYEAPQPAWETVLDIDALAAAEKANWVYKGVSCARPAERRCLVSLSDGGEDAVTVREFDLPSGKFVDGGFVLPKGKQRVAWEDENTLLVAREWRPGELGRTGYPYIVKRLKRGQPLSAATEVYRADPGDGGYGVTPYVLRDGENRTLAVLDRPLDTFTSETYILGPKGPQRVGIPAKASLSDMVAGRVVIQTREEWTPAGSRTTFPAGALLSVDLAQLKADPAHLKPTLIYAAGPREALEGASASKGVLVVSTLDNVRGRTLLFTPGPNGSWKRSSLPLPDNSTVGVVDVGQTDDRALIAVTSFLTPPALYLADAATGTARRIKSQPAKFDASNLVAEQYEATSSDGTKIPYFLVHRKDIKLDGANPTLLYAYGGFESSETPGYSATTGKLWLEQGGVYALANIRGGGEFGPKWHEAGLGVKRQIVFDDFVAVGRDLIARRITSPRRLGIRGGSNGGLLTGVAFTQHPELWNAALIEVPLLDMIRISKIAAGASWEGEYGSVDKDPAVRAFWEKTSPYHNLRRGTAYPEPFIFTTTKDDRVGPQHARKFAARMEEMGLPFFYYENTEGGHAAGANLKQTAHTSALEMIYLTRKLMD
ncbi:MAG: S9 family peptidase [Alphaproteobacteria bacterium]|nr:S9 family peptidase [Alphaproteobacteria bacterium]MBV9371779.1 S9 family peptidase [Alphaproteobacteria bacterium]MBV9901936.1 S9 family peptidase [Alphaproteobacteria bacterium]